MGSTNLGASIIVAFLAGCVELLAIENRVTRSRWDDRQRHRGDLSNMKSDRAPANGGDVHDEAARQGRGTRHARRKETEDAAEQLQEPCGFGSLGRQREVHTPTPIAAQLQSRRLPAASVTVNDVSIFRPA